MCAELLTPPQTRVFREVLVCDRCHTANTRQLDRLTYVLSDPLLACCLTTRNGLVAYDPGPGPAHTIFLFRDHLYRRRYGTDPHGTPLPQTPPNDPAGSVPQDPTPSLATPPG